MGQIKSGDKVPLSVMLYDHDGARKVRADGFLLSGEKVFTTLLYHVDNGIYMNSEIITPDVDHLLVTYTIEDSDKYLPMTERFVCERTKVEEVKFTLGLVKEKILMTEYIKGMIYETSDHK